jgi:hypothetical protein
MVWIKVHFTIELFNMSRRKERRHSQILTYLLSGLGFNTRKNYLWTLIRSDQQVIDTPFVIMDFIMQPLHIKEAEFTYMILLSFSYDNAINISLGRLLLRIGQLSL